MNKNRNFLAVIVIGPPGSGKGTQIKLLAEKFRFFHFISSRVGRDYIFSHNDPPAMRQKERYEKGLLFDKEWMFERVKEKTEEIFNHQNEFNGIIYDGSPRTLYEAEMLYDFLIDSLGKENLKIIEIDVRDEELKKRIEKRLICNQSGEHVFIESDELKPCVKCPECHGVLQERDIDKKEIFDVRMKEYKNQTVPALNFLATKQKIIKINGEQSIENVHGDILKLLNL
ncbi:MAG: nucleoside monophosphate kinase [Patescibacteria group bacterium]